jgi:hypothetical protein
MSFKLAQTMDGMHKLTCQGLFDLLVHNDVDLDATFGGSFEHVIESILLISRGRPTEVELRSEPPVEDVDALPRFCGLC